jgi:hypothetical protein
MYKSKNFRVLFQCNPTLNFRAGSTYNGSNE